MRLQHLLGESYEEAMDAEIRKGIESYRALKCPCGNAVANRSNLWWPVKPIKGIGDRASGYSNGGTEYGSVGFQCLNCGRIIDKEDKSVLRGPTINRSYEDLKSLPKGKYRSPEPDDPVIGESADFEFAPRYDDGPYNGPKYRKCPRCGDMMVGIKEIRGIGDRVAAWEIGDSDKERLDFSNGVACTDCGLVAEPQEPYRIIGQINLSEAVDPDSEDYESAIIPRGTAFSFIEQNPYIGKRDLAVEDSFDADDGAVVMMLHRLPHDGYQSDQWMVGVYQPERGIGNRIAVSDQKEIHIGANASFRASIRKTFNRLIDRRINPAKWMYNVVIVRNEDSLNEGSDALRGAWYRRVWGSMSYGLTCPCGSKIKMSAYKEEGIGGRDAGWTTRPMNVQDPAWACTDCGRIFDRESQLPITEDIGQKAVIVFQKQSSYWYATLMCPCGKTGTTMMSPQEGIGGRQVWDRLRHGMRRVNDYIGCEWCGNIAQINEFTSGTSANGEIVAKIDPSIMGDNR